MAAILILAGASLWVAVDKKRTARREKKLHDAHQRYLDLQMEGNTFGRAAPAPRYIENDEDDDGLWMEVGEEGDRHQSYHEYFQPTSRGIEQERTEMPPAYDEVVRSGSEGGGKGKRKSISRWVRRASMKTYA